MHNYGTRNVVETSIELSKIDKTSTWEEMAKNPSFLTWDGVSQKKSERNPDE